MSCTGSQSLESSYEIGTSFLPNIPLFSHLYEKFKQDPHAIIIKDASPGVTVTRGQFFRDVLGLRKYLLDSCGHRIAANTHANQDGAFIAILLPAGYDFWVAFMAVQAVGAVAVPLSVTVLPAEAEYFIKLCSAMMMITSHALTGIGARVQMKVDFIMLTIHNSEAGDLPSFTGSIRLEEKPRHVEDKGGMLLFTSGTSGTPKGVLHSRASLYAGATNTQAPLIGGPQEVFLSYAPVHWIAGINVPLVMMLKGACIEICNQVFSPAWLWKRIEKGDVTTAFASPALLKSLAEHFEQHVKSGDPGDLAKALDGLHQLRSMFSGSAVVPVSIMQYWQDLRQGRPLTIVYATTETQLVSNTDWHGTEPIPPRCVGRMREGILTNLADGDEGELKIKGPTLFKKYLSPNPNIMDGVFDDDGFYKTGDLARREGDDYCILGRASLDVIRVAGYKMNTNDIEEKIACLPEIQEVMVLRVIDDISAEQVGTIIRLSKPTTSMTLEDLRAQLTMKELLPRYKLPFALKILRQGEEIPKSSAGKPSKARAAETFFPEGWTNSKDVEVWKGGDGEEEQVPKKAFDWAGIESSK